MVIRATDGRWGGSCVSSQNRIVCILSGRLPYRNVILLSIHRADYVDLCPQQPATREKSGLHAMSVLTKYVTE